MIHINRYVVFASMAIVIGNFLTCSDNGTASSSNRKISINSQTSPCGGFKSLAKRSILPDDTMPCLEETLFWRYNATAKILTLLHRCVHDNCAAILSMFVVREGNRLIVHQTDARDPNMGALCDCTFDLYCEVPDISGQTVTLTLDTFSMTLDLSNPKGKIILRPLEYLYIMEGQYADLSMLSKYPYLKSLSIMDVAAYSDLSPISGLADLTTFSGCTVDSLGFLAGCTKLQDLDIYATQRLSDISILQSMPDLKSLTINGASSLRTISPIVKCAGLTYLRLELCEKVSNISPLGSCKALKNLFLSGLPLVSDISCLSALSDLTDLTLDGLSGISSIEPLRSLTKMENLSISGNHSITDISPLTGKTVIKNLALMDMTAISDFSPVLSCLDSGDALIYPGTPVPQDILDQLKKKGVNYKGGMNGK